jgi:DAK2 domain fusion protein YloV
MFKKMVINAAAAIEKHAQEINELNVFPVPDGDTGLNMSLTMGAAEKALATMTPGTIGHTADVVAGALLRGARGNSGVILSLLFRGFARWLKDADTANAEMFADALSSGVDSAYKAVMKPAEGTILTVSRLASAKATAAAETERDVEAVLAQAISAGNIALAETVNQNPVLKKAGVIDAGAKGYIYLLDAMLKSLRGEVIEKASQFAEAGEKADFAQFATEDIRFAYCTEFIVERKYKTDINRLSDYLDIRGDSVVVVGDDEIIKVHVHTNEPGVILTEALTHGPLLSIKIENMHQQHSETLTGGAPIAPETYDADEAKEFGTVVVCAGDGISEVFRNLGADRIISGGQTMNPSTDDILKKINATPSDVVFVLPNNKNIVLAAQQCAPLTDKRVIVIPTKSIPQGVSAMIAIDDANGVDDIAECMTEAAGRVHTALITRATRDSVFDGREIKEGEYLALIEDSLAANDPEVSTVIDTVADVISGFSPEFITVFAGIDAGESEAANVAERISAASAGAETTVINGGQPVYSYIISAE